MANFRAMRPSTIATTLKAKLRSTRKALSRFARPQSFSFPNPFSLPSRIRRNLSSFKIHYSLLLWISLLLSLAPHHKPTMLFLMAASKFALLYEVIKKGVPGSWMLVQRGLDRRVMMGFFVGVVLVEIWATGAVEKLGVAVGEGGAVVLLHAVFFRGDEGVVGSDLEMGEGEKIPIGGEKEKEKEKEEDADLGGAGGGGGGGGSGLGSATPR